MSSLVASPGLAVSGDVGVLAEENAQRLISIFMEAGMSCLLHLRDVVEKELRSKGKDLTTFPKFYKSGLASIGQWSSDMLQGEVADIEAQYPETRKLHQFVFVSVLSEAVYSNGMTNLMIPSVSETYHSFLKRLVGNADVQRGAQFLEMPLCHRRVVFLDAFRNAYHDMARKCASAQAESMASQAVSARTSSSTVASEGLYQDRRSRQKAGSASTVTSEDSKPTKSRLQQAISEARETTPAGPKTPSAASELRLPPVADKVSSHAPEPEKDSKDVLLLDSPSFFEEEKSVAPPIETSHAA
jgi:hypothetical protein